MWCRSVPCLLPSHAGLVLNLPHACDMQCLQAFVLRACEQVVLRSRLDHLAKHVSRVLQHALDVTGLLEVVLVRQDHVKAIAGGPRVAYIGGGNRKGVDGILTAVEILDHSHVKILPSRNWKGGRARTGRSLNY